MNALTEYESTGIPAHHWGALSIELVLKTAPIVDICRAYDTTPQELDWMLEHNKEFGEEIKRARATVKATGPKAGFILRAQALAEQHLRTVHDIALSPSTHPSVRLKAVENLATWARLAPQPGKGDNTGVMVQINLDSRGVTTKPVTIEQD